MKWFIKKVLALLGLYSEIPPPPVVETVDVFQTPKKTTIVSARTRPFRSGNFFRDRNDLVIMDGFHDEFGIEEQEIVQATAPRRYGALPLSRLEPGIEIPLSRLEDIAALITAQPNGQLGLLYTGGVMSIFHTKRKDGKVCEGFIYHSRELSFSAWYIGSRPPGQGEWDRQKTWVIFPIAD